MARNEMIKVDGQGFTPSAMDVSYEPVNASDSGRVLDANATMYTNRITIKTKIKLEWLGPDPEEASRILKAFAKEYFSVTYPDPKENKIITKQFYCGPQSVGFKVWTSNNKRYSKVGFNIIER